MYRVIPWYNPIRGHGILILTLVPGSSHAGTRCSPTHTQTVRHSHAQNSLSRAFINTLRYLPPRIFTAHDDSFRHRHIHFDLPG